MTQMKESEQELHIGARTLECTMRGVVREQYLEKYISFQHWKSLISGPIQVGVIWGSTSICLDSVLGRSLQQKQQSKSISCLVIWCCHVRSFVSWGKTAEYNSQEQDCGASVLGWNPGFALSKLLDFSVPVYSFIKWGIIISNWTIWNCHFVYLTCKSGVSYRIFIWINKLILIKLLMSVL